MMSALLLCIALLPCLCGGQKYGIFLFPPPGSCFPDPGAVYLSSAVSDALFAADSPVARSGLGLEFRVNGMHATTLFWNPGDGTDADEGIAHHLALPGLQDGTYTASMRLFLKRTSAGQDEPHIEGEGGDAEKHWLGSDAETRFTLDSRNGCVDASVVRSAVCNASGAASRVHRRGGIGSSLDGKGNGLVLVNIAAGAKSWQSSTSDGHGASFANDGETMVSRVVQGGYSRTNAQAGAGEGGKGAWWEVDLGWDREIETIDVRGGRRANGEGSYPPVVESLNRLGPFDIAIHSSAWALVAERRFGEGEQGQGLISWVSTGARGRYVRVRLVASGACLELSEVLVWAWEQWDCGRMCLHGTCSAAGACECNADYMGKVCETSILADDAFLPAHTWLLEKGGGGGGWDQDEYVKGVAAVEMSQRPQSCTSEGAIVMGFHSGGLAATISLITGMHSMAFSLGKALLLWRRSDWFYADRTECPSKQLDCYFEPWHNCTVHDVDTFTEGAVHLLSGESKEAGVQMFAHVPPQYRHHGLFWWRTVMTDFIFRPLDWFSKDLDIDSLLEEMGLGGGAQFIGMHVRAGDSCIKWQQDFGGDCVGLHHHLSHARLLSERYGIKDIFVATDDPAVLERLRDKEKTSGGDIRFVGVERYRSLLQEMEKTKDVWTENRLRRGEVPAGPLLRSTVADILVLSRASAFVLHFASNLSRLAYQLALTRTRRHLPFVSVDGAWCYHWQLCCNVDRSGRSYMCS